MKRSLVQILVAVASIQMRSLKTEVEKGSIRIVVKYGLVDPKGQGRFCRKVARPLSERELG